MTPLHILIVDDEPAIVDMLSYNLQRANYQVIIARDGDLLLQHTQKLPFEWHRGDLVIETDRAQESGISFEFWPRLIRKCALFVLHSTRTFVLLENGLPHGGNFLLISQMFAEIISC